MEGENLKFVGILEVHYLIADVVGRLHDIHEWMAGENARSEFRDTELDGNLPVDLLLALKESELTLTAGMERCVGIFHYGGERTVGHGHASAAASLELMGQKPE